MENKKITNELDDSMLEDISGGMGNSLQRTIRYGEMVWVIKQNPCTCSKNEYGIQRGGNAGSRVAGQAAEGNKVVCSYCRTQIATYMDVLD